MDFLQIGKSEYLIDNYNKSEEELIFTINTDNFENVSKSINGNDPISIHRYAENDGKKGDLYISEQHYGYRLQTAISNYASEETKVILSRPTITIKGVADTDRIMTILENAGYKVDEKGNT